jgi:excisionase family DNA binding protein
MKDFNKFDLVIVREQLKPLVRFQQLTEEAYSKAIAQLKLLLEDKETEDIPKLLTTAEVSKILNTTRQTVDRWVNNGDLPKVVLNGTVRFKLDDLNMFIEKNTLKNGGK